MTGGATRFTGALQSPAVALLVMHDVVLPSSGRAYRLSGCRLTVLPQSEAIKHI
jgi:hypothetical protein